jgi:organic radical activating enzyme
MKPTFVSGRNNLSVTIMVPFDCPNNCPFCESKKEYATHRPSLDNVINSIKKFFRDNNTLKVPEVVITGGEPMTNILALRKIINAIPSDKDIYINTTLLKVHFQEFVALVNSEPQIKGINVSRHEATYEEDCRLLHCIAPDGWFRQINKSIRINCVVNNGTNIYDIMDRWEGQRVELSFRENFNTMTEQDLHNPYSGYLPRLASELQYEGHTQCKVCDTTIFKRRSGLVVRYHKGIKHTLVRIRANHYEVNDIIIRQDGEVFADWDFSNKTLLPIMLLHDDLKEVMERSRQRMVEIASTPYYTCGGYGGCGGVNYTPRFSCGGGSSCG